MHTAPPTARISRDATRFTVTVRRLDDAPEIAQLVELHDDNATLTRGRDAVFAAITRALARGERLELVPVVRSVSSESDDAAGLRAAVLHDPASRSETSSTLSLQTPQDMHLLGLRLERPSSRAAREVYATLLGVDVGELRGAENRGVWRWYVSDRTVRWAPLEGAPWALRWKARRSACRAPRELWELLASRLIIPPEWVGTDEREFFDAPSRSEKATTADCPVTLHSALALASDVEGMASAERLVFEAVGALAPWGTPRPAKIRWSACGATRHWYDYNRAAVIPGFLSDLVDRSEVELARRRPFLSALERAADVHYSRSHVARCLVELSLAWRQWCAEDRRVPGRSADWPTTVDAGSRRRSARAWHCPEALAGKRFRDLVDPTVPLLGIVSLGYTPDAITAAAATICYRVR